MLKTRPGLHTNTEHDNGSFSKGFNMLFKEKKRKKKVRCSLHLPLYLQKKNQYLKLSRYVNNTSMFRNQSFNVSAQQRSKLIFCLLRRHIKYFNMILCAAFQIVMKRGTAFSSLSIYGSNNS